MRVSRESNFRDESDVVADTLCVEVIYVVTTLITAVKPMANEGSKLEIFGTVIRNLVTALRDSVVFFLFVLLLYYASHD